METTGLVQATRSRLSEGPWQLAAAAVCGCALVALVDPTEHALTPPCPLRVVTGWWCPFCGATRAASRLIRGDLTTALHFNAAAVVLLPIMAVIWAAYAFPERLPALDVIRARGRQIFYATLIVMSVFMVIRNIPPGETWLRYPGA